MDADFEALLASDQRPVAADFSSSASSLLVAFGGIATGLGIPPFEFFRLAAELPAKRLFVRDFQQAWYQRGLPGIAEDIAGVATFLRRQIEQLGVNRIVFVGNSMGGYAAILLGALLKVDEVHAFAPQTFLGRWRRLAAIDRRWRAQIRAIQRDRAIAKDYFDLRSALGKIAPRTTIHIHFAAGHRLDRIHARRLADLPSVAAHPHQHHGHNLVKRLRDDGTLKRLLCDALVPRQGQKVA